MVMRLDQMPPCEHRGELDADKKHFPCSHPVVARGKSNAADLPQVHFSTCMSCKFVGWDGARAVAGYRQRNDDQPTPEDFAARVAACEACPVRKNNYCPPAGSDCNLQTKLSRCHFRCPVGRFDSLPVEEGF